VGGFLQPIFFAWSFRGHFPGSIVAAQLMPAHRLANKGFCHQMSWSDSVEKTVTGMGYEVVDVERSAGGLLRVFIDRVPGHAYPTGDHEFVTVEDCEAVTRQLQYALEVHNLDYARLEVSSPGLDRPLKRVEDYARFVGHQVQITLKLPFQGRKKFQGVLQSSTTEGSGWQLIFNDGKVDQVLDFAFDEVREARLQPVLDFKGRRGKGASEAAQPAGETDGGQQQ
jgi:ribosome maturation factor RimP